ncbi:MAG: sensor domain-containing protein [Segniliparus sp.]|uniref:sensor domain-containing protein n=1 Tax=Segniliparus sp. TaxID=2804064 RepID=UPI003F3F070E
MRKAVALLLGLVALAAGCERGRPGQQRQPETPVAGPILTEEAPELLSRPGEILIGGKQPHRADFKHSVYTHSDPAQCPFMVVEESPLLPKEPLAENSAWWDTDGMHSVVEVAAVYPQGFDAAGYLAGARQRLAACYGEQVSALTDQEQGNQGTFQQGPAAGTPNAQLWSWGRAGVWTCSYGLVAKHNAVAEVASCERDSTFDLRALVLAKEHRLDQLAHPQV